MKHVIFSCRLIKFKPYLCSSKTMKYTEFESIVSLERMRKYIVACGRDKVKANLGNDWLRDFILPGGALYYEKRTEKTRKIIANAYNGPILNETYSNSKLLSEMEFGIWKHMFSKVQHRLSDRTLIWIFPNKPKPTQNHKLNNAYVFQTRLYQYIKESHRASRAHMLQ